MTKLQKDEILVREIIDIDTNYMEDEDTGQSAKQKNLMKEKITKITEDKIIIQKMMMNLILHLQQWKLKLNQKFYKQLII